MDIAQLCRLCANAASLLLPIFEAEGVKQRLEMKINNYLPIQVVQDDSLPHHVCYSCSTTLNTWHNLVEDCIISDKKLRNLVDAQHKSATVMVNEDVSFQDAVTCDESEDENAEKIAMKDETDGNAAVSCGSARCEEVFSVLSKFRIKKSPGSKTSLHDLDPNKVCSSSLSQDRDFLKVECHDSDVSDNRDGSQYRSKSAGTTTSVDFPRQVFVMAEINQYENPPKSVDLEFSSVCQSKSTEQSRTQSIVNRSGFVCDVCQTGFSCQQELAAHTVANHSHRIRCKYCVQICTGENQLKTHEQLHQKDLLLCRICGKKVSTFRTLKLHFSVHADTGLKLCNFCNSVFPNKGELKSHEATHQIERPYLCETCGKAFRYKANMLNHSSTHLDDSVIRKFKCDICSTVYRSKNILKRHLALHTTDVNKKYVCETCGKSFLTVQNLNIHLKVHSNSRPYKCSVCDLSFKWKKNLRTHQHVHGTVVKKNYEDERKRRMARVQCEICGKYLASKWNLSVHVKRHDVNFIGSSMCHICGKTLCDSQAMSRHLKVHAGIKPFKCAICGKNFGTKMSRDDHERTHTGEKPFCCDVCGKCFSSKPHLHVHRVIHSDARPFKCTYCPKSFRRRPHLVLHIRTHTGEKPYSCEMCSRAFIQKNDMVKHMLTHSNERPFICECGISFRQKRDLNKHKRKHVDVDIPFSTTVPCM